MPTPAILLFVKAPVPGEVKTRLAEEVGEKTACEIYRQLVERQVGALPPGWPVEIHFAPATALSQFTGWLGSPRTYYPQPFGDLGIRLRTASAGAFSRGHQSVLLIGGDCPTLDGEALEEAATALENGADVVIGPARDGGYYLLGLSRPIDSVFNDIPWSGPDVARVTAQRAQEARLNVAWLSEREDVDDLNAYRRALSAGRVQPLPTVAI